MPSYLEFLCLLLWHVVAHEKLRLDPQLSVCLLLFLLLALPSALRCLMHPAVSIPSPKLVPLATPWGAHIAGTAQFLKDRFT
jgi:hypothetical protein